MMAKYKFTAQSFNQICSLVKLLHEDGNGYVIETGSFKHPSMPDAFLVTITSAIGEESIIHFMSLIDDSQTMIDSLEINIEEPGSDKGYTAGATILDEAKYIPPGIYLSNGGHH